jgi:putative PIN family toxin of toxin-antitoxin system
MRVVIDTNILIGSTWDEFSHSKKIIDEVIKGNITACGTDPMLRENKLLLKKAIPNPKQKEFLQGYFARLKEVPVKFNHQVVDMDPEDDKFINAALSAKAGYLITNDDHLLQHNGYEGLKIVRPKDFWYEYDSEDSEAGRQKMLDLIKDN